MKLLLLSAVSLAAITGSIPAESVRFIPATPDNTTFADGATLSSRESEWKWHPDQGNGGVWKSEQDQGGNPETLMVNAVGLQPGAVYEVFGYFWAEKDPPAQRHAIQLGLSLATMHPFGGVRPEEWVRQEPWVITPGYKTGQAYGLQAVEEENNPLHGLTSLSASKGNTHLIRARLGSSRAAKDGTLPVFFSPNFGTRDPGQSTFDGIALRPAEADERRNPATRIHLAIRAGDPVTIRRELEAGADVYAFDEEKLTPLFYAAACGDVALVRDLLSQGARPDQPGQSASPLMAAATIGNTEITRILLDAGAEVPLTPPADRGALAVDIDPRLLHPVVAAIRSGSVPL